jgi:hypothetical protein
MQSPILLYQTAEGKVNVEVTYLEESFWLTQKAMALLFQTSPQNITTHLKNIFETKELNENSTCKDYLQVQKD